jgi:hypothetical protein
MSPRGLRISVLVRMAGNSETQTLEGKVTYNHFGPGYAARHMDITHGDIGYAAHTSNSDI